jgi:hypothetical protein
MTLITHSLKFNTRSVQSTVYDPETAIKTEFSRLIHAAIINRTFCQRLLDNPLRTIESGYCGESFHFSPELKERIQLIHATTLESFSAQLLHSLSPAPLPERISIHTN